MFTSNVERSEAKEYIRAFFITSYRCSNSTTSRSNLISDKWCIERKKLFYQTIDDCEECVQPWGFWWFVSHPEIYFRILYFTTTQIQCSSNVVINFKLETSKESDWTAFLVSTFFVTILPNLMVAIGNTAEVFFSGITSCLKAFFSGKNSIFLHIVAHLLSKSYHQMNFQGVIV